MPSSVKILRPARDVSRFIPRINDLADRKSCGRGNEEVHGVFCVVGLGISEREK